MKTIILIALLALGASPAWACGGDGMPPQNSRVTASAKVELRAAYLRAHPDSAGKGPAAGHTYYSVHMGLGFAVATFDGRPRVFLHVPHRRWHLVRDTWGLVCGRDVPMDVLTRAWWFPHSQGQCYRVPGA